MSGVRIESLDRVARVTLCRPDVRNALDRALISELTEAVSRPPSGSRVLVLTGEGSAFCAGADAAWMRRSRDFSREQNLEDAASLGALLRALEECPLPVVARVQGPALGGGAGIAAACDLVIAGDAAVFGFPEVRLGLIPAVIGPYVLSRIGESAARRYFLTGERFDAETAVEIGLAHEAVPADALEARIEEVCRLLLEGGGTAQAAAKRLIRDFHGLARSVQVDHAVRAIADLRVSPEAQEGLTAFLEKRKPRWS